MKKQKTGGRQKGSLNKATIERAEQAAIVVAKAQAEGRVLAKDVLETLMNVLMGMVTFYQPTFEGMARQNANGDPAEFERWLMPAILVTKELAKYQSPQLRAIMVAPAPDTNQVAKRKSFQLTIFENQRALPPPPGAPTSGAKH